jgi:segregation and condensation protein B
MSRQRRTSSDDDQAGDSHPAGRDAAAEGISLESLSSAFAEMMRPAGQASLSDEDTRELAGRASDEPSTLVIHSQDALDPRSAGDGGEVSPKSLLEAMLFVGHPDRSPVTTQEMAALMRDVEPAELDVLVRELNQQYAANRCPYHIESVSAGYRLTLRDEFSGIRDKFYGRVREARLSQAAVEVLAIVAYKGPLTADDVNRLRGKPSGSILAQLVRRRLLEYRRNDQSRRSATYVTTPRFLGVFGLESMDDLPRSHDLDSH